MIDTLNLWLDSGNAKDGNPFFVLPYLNNVEEHNSDKRGYSCSGELGDYVVYCSQLGISLKGSLAKYYLPSNVFTLTRQTAGEAIEKMSDELHLDIGGAKVTRVDISTIIPTQRQPNNYYSSLGNKARFTRLLTHPDTLYYNQRLRQLIFYDKTKEASTKGAIIPPALNGNNLLRYEMRLLRNPQRLLKSPEMIRGADLIGQDNYYKLVQLWKREFDDIKKINNIEIMTDSIKTPKDGIETLLATLLQEKDQSYIDDYLALLRAKDTFADPKYYSRLKASLNKIRQAPTGAKSELMSELETAISNVARYAR